VCVVLHGAFSFVEPKRASTICGAKVSNPLYVRRGFFMGASS
jgi:hypothetical protein